MCYTQVLYVYLIFRNYFWFIFVKSNFRQICKYHLPFNLFIVKYLSIVKDYRFSQIKTELTKQLKTFGSIEKEFVISDSFYFIFTFYVYLKQLYYYYF